MIHKPFLENSLEIDFQKETKTIYDERVLSFLKILLSAFNVYSSIHFIVHFNIRDNHSSSPIQ